MSLRMCPVGQRLWRPELHVSSFVRRTPLVGGWTSSRPSMSSLLKALGIRHSARFSALSTQQPPVLESGSVHSPLDLQRRLWTRLPWNSCFPLSVFRPCSCCIHRRHFCSPIARWTFQFGSSCCVAIRHVSHEWFLYGKSSLLLTISVF